MVLVAMGALCCYRRHWCNCTKGHTTASIIMVSFSRSCVYGTLQSSNFAEQVMTTTG